MLKAWDIVVIAKGLQKRGRSFVPVVRARRRAWLRERLRS